MTWPLAVPFGGATPADYLALLQRLLPDGYSSDPDGPRVTELEAYAYALWIGRVAIDRAMAQALVDRTTELLPEWEQAMRLPNDASRSIEERQERLVAATRAQAGASAERLEAVLASVAPLASVVANTQSEIEASAALDSMIWHIGVQLDATELDDPATRRSVARILWRQLPARLHPVPGFRSVDTTSSPAAAQSRLFEQLGPKWGTLGVTDPALGRWALRPQDATTYEIREPANRHREYAGLVRLDAEDLNALQDLTLMQAAAGADVADAYTAAGDDMAIIHFAHTVAAASVVLIDDSRNWLDRYVLTALRYSDPGTDMRPGQASDTTIGTSTGVSGLWSTLDGGAGTPSGDYWTFATDLHLFAALGDGRLWFSNRTASEVSIVGVCVGSPDLGKR